MFTETENLAAYQKAHELVLDVYKLTKSYPKDEQFGLVSQMRRSASSIPANIAEGRGRGSKKEYQRFLLISRGSLEELKYHMLLSKDLEYISKETYTTLTQKSTQVSKLLNGIIKNLNC